MAIINSAFQIANGSVISGVNNFNLVVASPGVLKNILYELVVQFNHSTPASLSASLVTSPSATWTKIASQNVGTSSPTRKIEVWRTMFSADVSSETINIAAANGIAQTEMSASLLWAGSVDCSGTFGSGAVRAVAGANLVQGDSGVSNVTTLSLPYPVSFASPNNAAHAAFAIGPAIAFTTIPRTGWTKLQEFATSAIHYIHEFRADNDSAASFSGGSSGVSAGIAFELVAAPNPIPINIVAAGSSSGGTQGTTGFPFAVTFRAGRGLFLVLEANPTATGITDYSITSLPSGVTATQIYKTTAGANNGRLTIIWQCLVSGTLDISGTITFLATGGTVSGSTNQNFIVDLVEAQNMDATVGTNGVIQLVSGTAASGGAITVTPAAFAKVNNLALVIGGGGGSAVTTSNAVPNGFTLDVGHNVASNQSTLVAHRNSAPTNFTGTSGSVGGSAVVMLELQGIPAANPPTITLDSPSIGPILATDAILMTVTDAELDLNTVEITANGVTVRTGAFAGAFSSGFTVNSLSTGVTGGRQYSVRNDLATWAPGALVINVTAADVHGNTRFMSFAFSISGAAPAIDLSSQSAASVARGNGDVALVWDVQSNSADMAIADDDVAFDAGLRTAMILSLFTDRRAELDDEIPSGDGDRRGWWADQFAEVEGDLHGSRLWLLARSAQRGNIAQLVDEYCREALKWMLDDNVASRIDVLVEETRERLAFQVSLTRPTGNPLTMRFAFAWDAEAAR